MEKKNNKFDVLASWAVTIAALSVVWPVGLFLLFRLLSRGSLFHGKKQRPAGHGGSAGAEARAVRDESHSQRRSVPKMPAVPLNNGSRLRLAGWITSGIGALALLRELSDLIFDGWYPGQAFPLLFSSGVLATGVMLLLFGFGRKRKAVRMRRYLMLIDGREGVSIDALARVLPVSYEKACRDLQDMIEEGILPPTAYLDQKRRRLMLHLPLEDEPPAEPAAAEPSERDVLTEIRMVNDRIGDPDMSRKIDRIGEITARILDYQRREPAASAELRSFLGYYLPTTLKLLRTYATLEEQDVEGENISNTKESIEAALDKVTDGFEKQLDKLFRADALDITSDIQVLEQMLQRDGLADKELRL